MRGYRIIALSDRAKKRLLELKSHKKNKIATIEVTSQEPYTISVLFNERYKIVNFIKKDIVYLWAQRDMPFCQKGRDYDIEVLE